MTRVSFQAIVVFETDEDQMANLIGFDTLCRDGCLSFERFDHVLDDGIRIGIMAKQIKKSVAA